jgi:hypothetical protein
MHETLTKKAKFADQHVFDVNVAGLHRQKRLTGRPGEMMTQEMAELVYERVEESFQGIESDQNWDQDARSVMPGMGRVRMSGKTELR